MDLSTVMVAVAVSKSIPGTAAERAETAASNAEASADRADTYACSVSIDGHKMVITTSE